MVVLSKNYAVVGAGLMGRVMALKLALEGYMVTLFDKDTIDGYNSCAYAGGGLLTPYTELDSADDIVFKLSKECVSGWREIVELLPGSAGHVYIQQEGSLVVAHQPDMPDLRHLQEKITSRVPENIKAVGLNVFKLIDKKRLRELEPEINFEAGLYFPNEGQIDNRQLVKALAGSLQLCNNVTWRASTEVSKIEPRKVTLLTGEASEFDWVIDCRGMGAKEDMNLRGVRGEIIRIHAPEVTLNRPVRLIHPRYVIYIIPREDHHFVIGATSLETEDKRQVTVQSALELLSAAFSVHKGFAEAEIIDMSRNWRPASANNLPQINCEPGLMQINGLYRWGFMLTPALSRLAMTILNNQYDFDVEYASILNLKSVAGVAA